MRACFCVFFTQWMLIFFVLVELYSWLFFVLSGVWLCGVLVYCCTAVEYSDVICYMFSVFENLTAVSE